jgi:iron complex outermembrane receptor protein
MILSLESAPRSAISGRITDSENGKPLSGVTVRLDKTGFGTISNADGTFFLRSVPVGSYTLIVSIIGYQARSENIEVRSEDTLKLELSLNTQIFKTQELVITAGKRIQAVQDVPISLSVIDSKLLNEMNVRELDEAIQYVPGVNVYGDHVSIRGSSGFAFGLGSRVSMLLDGFPMLSADNGDMKFDIMPLLDIQRIEIIKGAGSALYGTSALGGVINVITYEPKEAAKLVVKGYSGLYSEPRYDSWQYSDEPHYLYGVDGAFSQKFGKLGIMLSANYNRDESYQLYKDSYRYGIFGKLNYEFSSLTNFTINFNYSSSDKTDWVYWNSLDSATRPPVGTNLDSRVSSDKLSLFGDLKQIIDKSNFIVFKTGIYNTYLNMTLPEDDPNYRQSDATGFNNELQWNSNIDASLINTMGLNYIYNTVNSRIYGEENQYFISLYDQIEYSGIDKLILTMGGRYDYEKTSGAISNYEFSPKLGLNYSVSEVLHLRASFGRGFRAASIAERYASVDFQGFQVMPNPDIKSEYSWSYEIGSTYSFDISGIPLEINAAAFDNELYDLIEPGFTDESFQKIKFINVTRARIMGVEIEMKGFFGLFGAQTGFTYMDPRDLTLDEVLKYRPKVLWYSKVYVPWEFLELSCDYRYMSEIESVDDKLKFQVKDYDAKVPVHIVDMSLSADFEKLGFSKLRATLIAKNMLDYYYVEYVGSLGPTMSLVLQLDFRL